MAVTCLTSCENQGQLTSWKYHSSSKCMYHSASGGSVVSLNQTSTGYGLNGLYYKFKYLLLNSSRNVSQRFDCAVMDFCFGLPSPTLPLPLGYKQVHVAN